MASTFDEALERVPHYERFLGVDELYAYARAVAAQHPSLATYREVGSSTDGQAIPMVSIGSGPKSALLFACPHPNEPIGAMLIHFLLDELVANPELRSQWTWHLLPCVDPDGVRLNEGWFAGPFTIRNYARNFYRPRSEEQVEWTFPLSYKTFSWQTPIPETRALMAAFDATRPDFVYSLHNAGFGGVYYYISRDVQGAYEAMSTIPGHRGLFLSLGEPEMPWAVEFAPAVYRTPTAKDAYDYFEKYAQGDPASFITGGGSSFDYLQPLSGPLSLVTELPYFQSPQISDEAPIEQSRRDVILEGIERTRTMFSSLSELLEDTRAAMTEDTRFLRAVSSFAEQIPKTLDSKAQWARTTESMAGPATVAQLTDELYVGTFYRVLVASMLTRAFDAQLAADPSPTVEDAKHRLGKKLDAWISEIETNLDYSPIPIRTLVQVQYGAMLAVLEAM